MIETYEKTSAASDQNERSNEYWKEIDFLNWILINNSCILFK